jgi:putative tryptophan/tyrosine transport system substrate-binding protein
VRATQQASRNIPIVMGYSDDPVSSGFISSLAHPGANVTGLASSLDETTPKHLELLSAAVPGLSRVGLLVNPNNPGHSSRAKLVQAEAQKAKLVILPAGATNPDELVSAFATLMDNRVEAVMVAPDAFFNSQRTKIVQSALKNRLPSIFPQREYVEAGGLMSYGENLSDFYRRAAFYVDKILKGAQPADLPVQQPTKF